LSRHCVQHYLFAAFSIVVIICPGTTTNRSSIAERSKKLIFRQSNQLFVITAMSLRNIVRVSASPSSCSVNKGAAKAPIDSGCGEEDIWFERTGHEGTQRFRRHVRLALEDFQGHDFSSIIFKSILREVKERRFFWGEGEIALEISSDDVLYFHFEEAYQEEQERRIASQRDKEKSLQLNKVEVKGAEKEDEAVVMPTPVTDAPLPEKKTRKYFYCSCVVDVQSPIEDVKDVVFDLRDCEKWNPTVASVEEASNGLENSRMCNLYHGGFVDEQIVEETDSTIRFQVTTNKPSMLAIVGSEFRIEKMDEYTTRVTSTVVYRPKFMPLTHCFATGKLSSTLGASAWKNAEGIKHCCETGETVTDETALPWPPQFECEYK
jgi:hypothetical protein